MRKKKEEIVFLWSTHAIGYNHRKARARTNTQQQREQILRRNLPRSNQTTSNAFNLTATQTEPNASRTPFPSRRINARVKRKKKFYPSGKKREEKFKRKNDEIRTAVCNNSSSYWPARVTTLVRLATDALETTTFAPRRVLWVSADIMSISLCAYKSKAYLSHSW